MCGIFCSLGSTLHVPPDTIIATRLQSRGPDSTGTITSICTCNSTGESEEAPSTAFVTLHSTVLSLRGSKTTTQPYQDPSGKYTLCWNGEAWSITGKRPIGNDTEAVCKLLVDGLERLSVEDGSATCTASAQARCIALALSQIAGPYAFVFFDQLRSRLFFGRDFLGRRSLLTKITPDGDLLISSVSDGNARAGWTEVEVDGVYYVDLSQARSASPGSTASPQRWSIGFAPYHFRDTQGSSDCETLSVIPRLSLNKSTATVATGLDESSSAVAELHQLLYNSVALRVLDIPEPPVSSSENHLAKLAILFSGGLDCTVLARLSHDLVPLTEPIDLLNVAFENPRIHKRAANDGAIDESFYRLCPDRITGRQSYAELQRICSTRTWRFVAINVPYTENLKHRETIASLMHPHNTEMDLSIASALYFAARGQGALNQTPGTNSPYTTTARALLSGLGADELFAGYTRHATAFKRAGLAGLLDELELDVSRLGKRNLGRDDRVMSHWGKEVRFPFLDEGLLTWALDAPVTEKCGFGEIVPRTAELGSAAELEPGKKVLRCLAWKLGMEQVAREKKRAIQFGARTAKMETGKTKGTHVLA